MYTFITQLRREKEEANFESPKEIFHRDTLLLIGIAQHRLPCKNQSTQ